MSWFAATEEVRATSDDMTSPVRDLFVAASTLDNWPLTVVLVLTCAAVLNAVMDSSLISSLSLLAEYVLNPVPSMQIELTPAETDDDGIKASPAPAKMVDLVDKKRPGRLQCYDPSTNQRLGDVPAMTTADVGTHDHIGCHQS